jgi:3-deoxy-manno-octulosonate cytidylyltransferase (CMP-KDO synthetase)
VNHTGQNPQKQTHINAVAIIPARYQSTRLPGKVLSIIAGKPMIVWVAERARAASTIARVLVATDNSRVHELVGQYGFECIMTRRDHRSGTDRVAEVASSLEPFDIIVNVQGDEPLISPDTIDAAVTALTTTPGAGIATTWERIDLPADVLSADVVKIVLSQSGRAVYFSRSPIPFPRDAVGRHGSIEAALQNESELANSFKKHTGLYVYRRELLLEFTAWPESPLEQVERLEQLRALEHGVRIVAVQATSASISVDTPADLRRVELIMEGKGSEASMLG